MNITITFDKDTALSIRATLYRGPMAPAALPLTVQPQLL